MAGANVLVATNTLSFGGGDYIFDCDLGREKIIAAEIREVHPDENYAVVEIDDGKLKHVIFCNLQGDTITLFRDLGRDISPTNGTKPPTKDSVTAHFDPTNLSDRTVPMAYLRDTVSGQVAHIITPRNEHPDTLNPRPTWCPAAFGRSDMPIDEMLRHAGIIYKTLQGEFVFFSGIYGTVVKKGSESGEWIFAKMKDTKTPVNIMLTTFLHEGIRTIDESETTIPVSFFLDHRYRSGYLNLVTMEIEPLTPLVIGKNDLVLKTLDGRVETINIGSGRISFAEGDA